MTRRYDPRRAKAHRNYSRQELCDLFDVALPTIWSWMRKGLVPIEPTRPYLFAGTTVGAFLKQHNKPYQQTGPGEFYCVACKRLVTPAGGVVRYVPRGPTHGNLIGSCPACGRQVWQGVKSGDIEAKRGDLEVHHEDGSATFIENGMPLRTKRSGEIQS